MTLLSNLHQVKIPLDNTIFQFLYLSTNDIKYIPDHFFTSLPQLKWLDFRHNLLTDIPPSIGLHRCLNSYHILYSICFIYLLVKY